MTIIRNKPEVLFNLSKIERTLKELKRKSNSKGNDRKKLNKKSA